MTASFSEAHRRLVSDVRYGYWFNLKCESAYGHFALVLNIIQLVGGSLAVVSITQSSPTLTAWMGSMLAIVAALSLLIGPAVKAELHRQAKNAFLDLESRAWSLATKQLQADLARVRAAAPLGLGLLAVPAYNATMRAIGAEDAQRPESFWEKFVAALA